MQVFSAVVYFLRFFYGYEKCAEINYLFKETIIIDKRHAFTTLVGWDVGFAEQNICRAIMPCKIPACSVLLNDHKNE